MPVDAKGASLSVRMASGNPTCRQTPVTGSDRAPFCMMGACFDCLMEIDGVPNRQACLVEVREGMQVRRQVIAVKAGAPDELAVQESG